MRDLGAPAGIQPSSAMALRGVFKTAKAILMSISQPFRFVGTCVKGYLAPDSRDRWQL